MDQDWTPAGDGVNARAFSERHLQLLDPGGYVIGGAHRAAVASVADQRNTRSADLEGPHAQQGDSAGR
jgi:hypothetical protein